MAHAVDLPGSIPSVLSVARLFWIHSFLLTPCMLTLFVMIGPVVGEWGGLVERPTLLGCDAQVGVCL